MCSLLKRICGSREIQAAQPMGLGKFVSTTLSQIAEGVDEAEKTMQGKRFRIASEGPRKIVEFDVAVTLLQEGEASLGIAVSFAEVGVSAKSRRRTQGVSENRVKFGIPVAFGH